MKLTDVLYSLGWQTIRPFLAVAGMFSSKLARAVAGRKYAASRMRAWADGEWGGEGAGAAGAGPLVWLHGASAGELAGAMPVMAELRRRVPGLRLAVTYSSPSGENAAGRFDPVYAGFVPLDLRAHTDGAIAALAPDALVYAKLDVWPNLTASARRAGVPVGLVNGTVRPGSGRLRHPGRAVLRRAYAALDAGGAVSEEDASRLQALGARPAAIRVTGDAAFDQALSRVPPPGHGTAAVGAGNSAIRLPPRAPDAVRLVAGSTWAEDEAFLVEAVANLPTIELVLVPHEPTEAAVKRITERTERRLKRKIRLYSELDASTASPPPPIPPLVVDAVGFLAELYAEGDVAYVGGALAGTGLHSVIEPAAAGLPVLFGSRHDRWEARGLVGAGAAMEVGPAEIHAALTELLDADLRSRMGRAARAYVESRAGADRAGAELVRELLMRGGG